MTLASSSVLSPSARPRWLETLLGRHRDWRGGIHLSDHKKLSSERPLQALEVRAGELLRIPLGAGSRQATPCVVPGQAVLKGEVIACGGPGVVWVHASTSGTVVGIGEVQAADGARPVAAVTLEADGEERWAPRRPAAAGLDAHQLGEFALQMGLAGMGGAGFPTGIKLAAAAEGLEYLLINAAECEPWITCDDRLMRERADEIVAAADRLAAILNPAQVLVGVEGNKPEAIKALRQAARHTDSRLQVRRLPQRYPAGGQPLLVKSLTGRNLVAGMLPAELGVLVLNVATLHALGRALLHGEPLLSRVVTLTGEAAWRGNLQVPIGLAVARLTEQAQPPAEASGIQVGGPMMGQRLPHVDAVIGKTTSCLIFGADQLLPAPQSSGQCIRCNHCVDACPMGLQPLNMLAGLQGGQRTAFTRQQLAACIECGSCSHVCPSNLPLRDSFRDARCLPVKELGA